VRYLDPGSDADMRSLDRKLSAKTSTEPEAKLSWDEQS
jgi:hypothetical protein